MAFPSTTLYPQSSGLYPGDGIEIPPTVVTGVASGVSFTAATVAGTVNPNELGTHYYFEYGLTPRLSESWPPMFYGSRTVETDVGSGSSPVSVSANLTGLRTGRHYYYTLVAFNAAGFGYGAQGSFDTLVHDVAEFLPELLYEAGRGQ